MKKITAILIGAGDRGANAYASYAINNPGTIEFVAVAEKNDQKRKHFQMVHNIPDDMAFDNCLKKLIEYLRELCLNNHIRYKPKMNNLIDDMKILKDSMKEIEGDDRALLDI